MKPESSKSSPKPRKASNLEIRFSRIWQSLNGPEVVEEHRFHSTRKWRFDFAHLETKTAIEIEGGVWSGGRHTRGAGYSKDAEKYNEAAFEGWAIIRLVGSAITAENCEKVVKLINSRQKQLTV
jgi:very-short-patch-repair endonuclease